MRACTSGCVSASTEYTLIDGRIAINDAFRVRRACRDEERLVGPMIRRHPVLRTAAPTRGHHQPTFLLSLAFP
jgi:hypothetical protein